LLSILSFKTGVVVHFFFNQSEIIAKFCINKDAPALACNGKCHLSNELETLDKKESVPFNTLVKFVQLDLQFVVSKLSRSRSDQELAYVKKFHILNDYWLNNRAELVPTPPPEA